MSSRFTTTMDTKTRRAGVENGRRRGSEDRHGDDHVTQACLVHRYFLVHYYFCFTYIFGSSVFFVHYFVVDSLTFSVPYHFRFTFIFGSPAFLVHRHHFWHFWFTYIFWFTDIFGALLIFGSLIFFCSSAFFQLTIFFVHLHFRFNDIFGSLLFLVH
jgi:hypothetical protein